MNMCVYLCVLFSYTTHAVSDAILYNFCNTCWLYWLRNFHLSSFLSSFSQASIKLMTTHVVDIMLNGLTFVKATLFPRKNQETKLYEQTTVSYSRHNFVCFCLSAFISSLHFYSTWLFSEPMEFSHATNFRFRQVFLLYTYTRHCTAWRPRVIRYHLRLERTSVAAWRQQARQHTAFMGIDSETKENIKKKT
jgi:hypothetical protein